MKRTHIQRGFNRYLIIGLLFFLACLQTDAAAFTLNVVDNDGNAITGGFRWLLEEDNTNQKPPGVRVPDSIGVDIHKSHAPVVSKGVAAASPVNITVPDPTKPYFVSVLPDSGYTLSGTTVSVGQAVVNVQVHAHPIPTAQISILVFEDHNTINNVFDPGERGLGGWTIQLSDAGGPVSQDVFGNTLDLRTCTQAEVDAALRNCTTVGELFIKNLAPGKYGLRAIPPTGTDWVQTATIEGTPTVDAWVKANEPPKFFEGFGTGFYHVFFGFVSPSGLPWAGGGPGAGSISGRNVFNHFSRPPTLQGFFPGERVDSCWVGLNDLTTKQGLIAVPCDGNSNFTLPGIPPGNYQLVTWDRPLDALFGFNLVTVPDGGDMNVDLGNVLSFRWFGTLEGTVFTDGDQNGFRDCLTPNCDSVSSGDEVGIPGQAVNIRFRDGSIYQTTLSDNKGEYSLSEVFPFFKWLVVEVDFLNRKATGMTTAVDYGGQIPPVTEPIDLRTAWITPSFNKLNPQPQDSFSNPPDGINPNTGNNLSRTETGPVLTQAMHLFLNQTNVIDWGKIPYAAGENGGISGIVFYATTRAENDPRLAAAEIWEPGIPRVQVNLYGDMNADGVIDEANGIPGIQLPDVDNPPLGWGDGTLARGPEDIDRNSNGIFDTGDALAVAWTDSWDDNQPTGCVQTLPVINGQPVKECFDNFGTWNQVRPGLFDGGYAFGPDLPAGTYIVETFTPAGYELVKEEDKNVDFGDEYVPSPLVVPPPCVGNTHLVPAELSLFPGVDAPFAGQVRPRCDRKQVEVSQGQNAAADFYFFTEVPKAARNVGFVNNDLAAEFDPNSPIFGEKSAPAWIPVSYQDWAGNELVRVYSDEFGAYNALLPSTYTMNIPSPSGVSPNMLTIVLNHPILPDGTIDPFYDPNYAVAPWTFQFMPGTSTYTDTPIVPIASFVGFPRASTDMEPPSGVPVISSVTGPEGGPLVCNPGDLITITSAGSVQVPNPDFDVTVPGSPALITRDYGFGNVQGSVTVNGTPLDIVSWSNNAITATVPSGVLTGQLMVIRGNNMPSEIGVTLHVGGCGTTVRHVPSPGYPSIQSAIDAAETLPGDLIVVGPGVYHENVILYKNVMLQGSGAGASINDPNATIIFANPSPQDRLAAWHQKIQDTRGNDPFIANEAPGVMVFGDVPGSGFGTDPDIPPATTPLIDGFTVFGAIQGGGITAYNQTHFLQISNNKIRSNQGSYGGGIVTGMPDAGAGALINAHLNIKYNRVVGNGGVFGAGGIMLNSSTDNYIVSNNIIAGNLSRWNGGGLAHYGLSNDALITNNKITFNEVFFGAAVGGNGGGIFISGEAANGILPGALGDGAGNVIVSNNLIQGNLAGSGNGGGINVSWFNGVDLEDPEIPDYSLSIYNNIVSNNVAALMAGGIFLQDVANSSIIHNTIAHNDSTATAALAFTPPSLDSIPQGAGVVSNAHSGALSVVTGGQTFSDPVLENNIVWQNRSFFNDHLLNGGAGGLAPNPAMPHWDLQVAGTAGSLNPQHCILTDATGYGATNIPADPRFITGYFNQLASSTVLDEGGNAITVRYTPLKLTGDYHILPGSPAINTGSDSYLAEVPVDYDGQARPGGLHVDIGADELFAVFSDVPLTHWAANYIYAIANNGITAGCGGGNFCPDNVVTRGQMAAFIIRAKYGETFAYTPTPYFTDVPETHTFFKYVQRLKDDAITTVTGTFGVNQYVTRAQMAAFLGRAFLGMP